MSFRVLFIYPNLSMSSMVPHSIAVLSAVLKKADIEVEVFDTTFYANYLPNSNKDKVRVFNALPYNFKERGISPKETDVFDDLRQHIGRFRPDLIAISFIEDTFRFGCGLLESVRDLHIPVVAGGIFCTYAPEKVLANPDIDYVVRGEGEKALPRLCLKLKKNEAPYDIYNLCYIKEGKMVCNPIYPPLNFDEIPFPDYSVFDEEALYRPMTGKIYRTVGIELHRGCPYRCGYCNSSANNRWYLEHTKKVFFRKRSIDSFAKEVDYMVKAYNPEFIYFISDTFLLMTNREFEHFCEVYSQYRLPFFMNTRAETVTEKRVKMLNEINCHRGNIGIEHGNEDFRRNVIRRNISDEVLVRAIEMIGRSDISTVSNNIIGFPGETRELIFDTVNLNRRIEKYCDSISCTIFSPYHGTALRKEAIELGYLDSDAIIDTACNFSSPLKMPQLTNEQITGLQRTFSMYVRMPMDDWPRIKIAEKFDDEGEKIYGMLSEEYRKKYLTHKKPDSREEC